MSITISTYFETLMGTGAIRSCVTEIVYYATTRCIMFSCYRDALASPATCALRSLLIHKIVYARVAYTISRNRISKIRCKKPHGNPADCHTYLRMEFRE